MLRDRIGQDRGKVAPAGSHARTATASIPNGQDAERSAALKGAGLRGKVSRMSKRRLPIGIQTFRKLREDGCYYVDKTRTWPG